MSTFPHRFVAALCCLAFGLLAAPPASADRVDDATLRAALVVERARPLAPRIERSAFLVDASIRSPVLSPDGRGVAYLQARGRNHEVWLLATAGGPPRRLLSTSDARQLYWSRNGRWLLLESPKQLFALAVAGQSGSGIVTTLGGRESRTIEAVDPQHPEAVIALERLRANRVAPQRWRLLRVDMRGRRTVLHEDTRQIAGFAFDAHGRLAFLERVEDLALVVHRVQAGGRLRELLRCPRMHRCSLLPATNPAGEALLRSDMGSDLHRVARLDGQGRLQTVHIDPRGEADLDQLVLDPTTGQPLIASYRSTVAASHGLDADTKRGVDAIARRFPQRNLRVQIGRGAAAQWLVSERASTLQSERLHLYHPRSGQFRRVLADAPALQQRSGMPAPWLPESALARKIPIRWRASDGMRLHGFVLVPPGVDPARAPLVAHPHGGPWNHSRPEYGAIAQFLVNRGHVVFEPNFRGSTGHGRQYMFSARGDFGNGRVQRDIVEGVRHVLAMGIGDARRVGIVGGSFGGYSTLLGVTFEPELFKVGIAFVPPPDFASNLRWIARSREALNLSGFIPFADVARLLSLDTQDRDVMARLHAQSPLANVARLRRPVVLIASGEDRRVGISGVIEYAARLKLLGKDVSLLVDPDAGHANHDPIAREAGLHLLEHMLHRHLGGAAPSPPTRELRDHLKRNLRIAGRDLR
ncbi:S9 family peptidase [Montanilutibacter psychrotolerans]|uniref:S9 family peptidase n=1 Tax=Montanilutibacter psychrotolerans TaxID=1327343 RepID=UPI0011CD99A0|nr:prolyl oligopeptidase family serine peptidase [Lysobacter psychrotolerans]